MHLFVRCMFMLVSLDDVPVVHQRQVRGEAAPQASGRRLEPLAAVQGMHQDMRRRRDVCGARMQQAHVSRNHADTNLLSLQSSGQHTVKMRVFSLAFQEGALVWADGDVCSVLHSFSRHFKESK